jgi:hypothetical protein
MSKIEIKSLQIHTILFGSFFLLGSIAHCGHESLIHFLAIKIYSPSAFVDGLLFTRDIIHIYMHHFHTYKEAKRSESGIGGCKSSRKHAGRATSSLFAKYSFENGTTTFPMAFSILAFVSNRETLQKSWRKMWIILHVGMWCGGASLIVMSLQSSAQVMSREFFLVQRDDSILSYSPSLGQCNKA